MHTVHAAAELTGWSARMLRYVEALGLVVAERSASGYRLYGPAQLDRLRALRGLLDRHDLELRDVAVAARLRAEPELAADVAGWFDAPTPVPVPTPAPHGDWLEFEQRKHESLLPPAPLVRSSNQELR